MVSKLDESVGRIVQALKDKNILQNTIIVFMSDNGSPSFDDSGRGFPAESGVTANWGSNFPFRGVSIAVQFSYRFRILTNVEICFSNIFESFEIGRKSTIKVN